MRGAALALLCASLALGCAQQALPPEAQPVSTAPVPDVQVTQLYPTDLPGPPGPGGVQMPPASPSERTKVVAARLPLRIGPWVRAVGPPDEGAIARNGLSLFEPTSTSGPMQSCPLVLRTASIEDGCSRDTTVRPLPQSLPRADKNNFRPSSDSFGEGHLRFNTRPDSALNSYRHQDRCHLSGGGGVW